MVRRQKAKGRLLKSEHADEWTVKSEVAAQYLKCALNDYYIHILRCNPSL